MPTEIANQSAETLAANPLAWMVVFLCVSGTAMMVFMARYILLPMRDAAERGHDECKRQLDGVVRFQQDTLVQLVTDNTLAFKENAAAVEGLRNELERQEGAGG